MGEREKGKRERVKCTYGKGGGDWVRVAIVRCRSENVQMEIPRVASEPIRDYRDLVAWQRAIELAVAIGEICDQLPRAEWELASQMRRSATSVHSSIAEGNGRPTLPGYLQSLGTSRSELNELESDLHYLVRRYGARTHAQEALNVALSVRRPLLGHIRSLRRKRGGN